MCIRDSFLLTAFALPWYLGYNSGLIAISLCSLILLSALSSIIYLIRSFRKSVIEDTGKSQAFKHAGLGVFVGVIIAVVQWIWNLSRYFEARGSREIQPADIVELVLSATLYGVLGFIAGLFIGLRKVKK